MMANPESKPECFKCIFLVIVQQILWHGRRSNNYWSSSNVVDSFVISFGRWMKRKIQNSNRGTRR